MAIHIQVDPLERTATLRGVHSLCAGESAEIVLSGVPDADTATMSLRLYRDRSEAEFVAAARRPGDADPPQEGFAAVQGRAALRRAVLDLRSESVASWASDVFERSESESDGPEEAPRPPETAWMVVADVSRVWAACEVPFLLRPMSPESADVSPTLPSLVERAEASARAAESAAERAERAAEDAESAEATGKVGRDELFDDPGSASPKVKASLLPSYVDDVLEVAELPQAGESGKLYVVTGTNAVYRWGGSSFVEVSPSRDWSGELAAKRDLTDLSVDPDKWLLVEPDGTLAWLVKPDPQRDEWTGDGFFLTYGELDGEVLWGFHNRGLSLVDDSADLPSDANRLEFTGSDGFSVYRLVRGSRLALDTEIPPAVTVDDTVTRTSANPVKSSGIWSAIWGALTALPTGFASLYDWCVAKLAGKLSTSGGTMTGVLNVGDTPDATTITPKGGVDTPKLDARTANISGVEIDAVGAGSVFELKQLHATTGAVLIPLPPTDAQPKTVAFVGDVADAADLRYRIAEAGKSLQLPTDVIVMYGGDVVTIDCVIVRTSGRVELQRNSIVGSENVVAYWNEQGKNGEYSQYGIGTFAKDGESIAPPDLVGAYSLSDRAVNLITATDETSIDIALPDPQEGYSRDFYLAVTCGSTAPTLNAPTGVTLVNAKGEQPDLSLSADATTVLRFTEVNEADSAASPATPAVFCVTGGANGGGGSIDPAVLDNYRSKRDLAVYAPADSWSVEIAGSTVVLTPSSDQPSAPSRIWALVDSPQASDNVWLAYDGADGNEWILRRVVDGNLYVSDSESAAADATEFEFEFSAAEGGPLSARAWRGLTPTPDTLAKISQVTPKADKTELPYDIVAVTPSNGVVTVGPRTISTYTAGDSTAAFTVAVGTGETGKARDCELVIDCTATGAVAPTVTWPATFHPRTDAATDFACEAGKRNVYFISEFAPGEFAVGGWQETAGGNAS